LFFVVSAEASERVSGSVFGSGFAAGVSFPVFGSRT